MACVYSWLHYPKDLSGWSGTGGGKPQEILWLGSTREMAVLNEGKPGKGRHGRSGARTDGTIVVELSLIIQFLTWETTRNCIRDKKNVDWNQHKWLKSRLGRLGMFRDQHVKSPIRILSCRPSLLWGRAGDKHLRTNCTDTEDAQRFGPWLGENSAHYVQM